MSYEAPSSVVAVFDNGGDTEDRYTVYVKDSRNKYSLYATSETPEDAGGMCTLLEGVDGDTSDVEDDSIDWIELPLGLRNYLIRRIEEDLV